jgi:hypothetical protein
MKNLLVPEPPASLVNPMFMLEQIKMPGAPYKAPARVPPPALPEQKPVRKRINLNGPPPYSGAPKGRVLIKSSPMSASVRKRPNCRAAAK